MKTNDVEREIEKTLDCFDQAPRLSPNPYLFTKLKTRMEEQARQPKIKPRLRPILAGAVLFANIITAVLFLYPSQAHESADSRQVLVNQAGQALGLDSGQNDLSQLFSQVD